MNTVKGIISTEALAKIIDQPNVKLIDASYFMSNTEDMIIPQIGGAITFDIDNIADKTAPLAHTLPSPEVFEQKIQELGINQDDIVICYDQNGVAMAACRAWWMFRLFGHDNVAVLDGGLPKWLDENRSVSNESMPDPKQGNFKSNYRPDLVRSADEMLQNIESEKEIVLDARAKERFEGTNPEISGGHIPKSLNVPFMDLLNHDKTFKQLSELKEILSNHCILNNKALTATCGSGVTACVVAMGLFLTGNEDVAIYDGSWTEWSANPDLPKKTGPAPSCK